MKITLIKPAQAAAALFVCTSVVAVAQTATSYTISTFAGNGTSGYSGDGGAPTSAQLAGPSRIAFDQAGTMFIADQFNQRIRQIQNGASISTIAGNGTPGYLGDGKGAISAEFYGPYAVVPDSKGNYYISDSGNNVIRKVTGTTISTVVGVYNNGGGYSGDGPGISTMVNHPAGLAIDSAGNLYIADTQNNMIRMLSTSGNVTTIAGNAALGANFSGDNGPATSAALNAPSGVAVDSAGNVYIADTGNHRIRKVSNGIITTIAGTGRAAFGGDGGPAIAASFNRPVDVAIDGGNNLYIADYANSRIRKIFTSGVITTIAGNGRFAYNGDGGPATSASLNFPTGVTVDSSGNVYIADSPNNVIRVLKAAASTGVPAINAGGVVSAASFGGSKSAAPGSWIEIYGTNMGSTTRTWDTSDFKGLVAPTTLTGVNVTIGGQAAFISYISPVQIDAQVPANVGTGTQAITVSASNGISQSSTITINPTQPGLFAPAVFDIGGKQYVGALFADGMTYVLPTGAVAGITSRPAKPGETITIYGIGFGAVTGDVTAGQIVQNSNSVNAPVQFFFGQVPASTTYAGLAPQQVGLYQFNVTVPNVAASDAVALTFTQGGTPGTQTLYTAIGN